VDPNNGNLYAVWDDSRFSDKYEYDGIAFSMSTDGGLNWSEPIKVNQTPTNIPPANQQAFVPSVAVADNGTVAITYYDFRNNTPDADLPADYWLVHASGDFTNPASWQSDEKRMTDASFNMANAPVSRGFFLGDYQGLAAAGNSFYALFAQAGANSNDPSSIWFRDPPPAPAGQETPTPTGALTTALAAARRDAVFYGTRLRSSAALGRAVSHTGAWKPALGVSPQRTPAARSELRVVTTDRALELITGERHEILSRSSSAATPLGSEADWFLRISPRLR
jgi:hypothetical protein